MPPTALRQTGHPRRGDLLWTVALGTLWLLLASSHAGQAWASAAEKPSAEKPSAEKPSAEKPSAEKPSAGLSRTGKATDEKRGNDKTDEVWEVHFLQGSKIGYGSVTSRPVVREGQRLVEIDSLSKFTIIRFGQRTEQTVTAHALETPEGQLLEFKAEIASGGVAMSTVGRREGKQLLLETQTKGRRENAQLPWSDDIQGLRGIEQSLERQPLKPGEKRSLKTFMPIVNQVAEVEIVAGEAESTSVLGIQTRLQRNQSVAKIPGSGVITSTMWTNAEGQIIKSRVEGLGQESFRTTKQLATSQEPQGAPLDLGVGSLVRIDPPLKNSARLRKVRYRVELAGGDPAKTFATDDTQSVRSVEPHVAEVTVSALSPRELKGAAAGAAVGPQYTAANGVLQVDDPQVRAMAAEGRGQATEPVEVALALEKYVHRVMTKKNFSQAFATAAEVAQSREGDCTEHAVLLAALARANQIPARVAIGLVYVEPAGGMLYHMWTEVRLGDKWVPLDGTRAQGGIGGTYLKLVDSSLEGVGAYGSFLPVAQVLGQLKVRVLEAE